MTECPKCEKDVIRVKEHPNVTIYIHEQDVGGGPLGATVLEDACRVPTEEGE